MKNQDVTDELISHSITKYQVNQHQKAWIPAEQIKMYNAIIPQKLLYNF